MVFQNDILAGSSGASGTSTAVHTIGQSIRFNDDDSAYMHRTPSSAGNRRTFTYSFWFKLGDMATTQRMFLSVRNSDTTRDNLIFNQGSSGDYRIYLDARVSGSAHTVLEPTRALRDPSAFYHFVLTVDTTNAVSNERVKMYINGIRETTFTNETYPSLNQEFRINNTDKHSIGRFEFSSPSGYFDGYMAEIHLLDGYAYDPSFFGEFNDSGIWIPKEYTGSYGTNGFKIDGRDSADLGDDESGNGNDFTASGLAAHDQVADSPTNNFAVLSPIDKGSMTLSEGNLKGTSGSSSVWQTSKATMGVKSGKWYWEVRAGGTTYNLHGTVGLAQTLNTTTSIHPGVPSDGYGWYGTNGAIYHNGGQIATESTYTTGDIISFALDLDDSGGILTAYKNGVSEGNLTTTYKTADTDDFIFPAVGLLVSDTCIINFGQDGTFAGNVTAGGNSDGNGIGNFKYSVPSGYLALCTKNLGS